MTPEITLKELVEFFREAGLEKNDNVIVHSSYHSIAPVAGGPGTVIDALLETIGPEGNLMLPTFNYAVLPLPDPYDVSVTPAKTGIIAETGRKRPDAVRSLHPTHSVAAIGPKADELTRDHLSFRAIGFGSPIDRLVKMGGKVLLIGVANTSNTTIHLGEEYAEVPKCAWVEVQPEINIRLGDGSFIFHILDTSPSCSVGFCAIDFFLRQRGLIRDSNLLFRKLHLMRQQDVIDCVRETIAAKRDVLLCTNPKCRPCAGSREILKSRD